MAGYSGTPLPQKLGLKAGTRFGVVKPPPDFGRTLGELPSGVAARPVAAGKFAVCAIDHVWSGLRFVYRVADRPKGTGR